MTNKQWFEKFRDDIYGKKDGLFDRQGNNISNQVENFICILLEEREAEIRKETLEAVIPKKEDSVDIPENQGESLVLFRNNGWNSCRQSIMDQAKSLYNINLE